MDKPDKAMNEIMRRKKKQYARYVWSDISTGLFLGNSEKNI